jgi:uncharacterized protein
VAAWRQGAIDVVLSRYILDELARVLPRLNHRLGWRPSEFADLIDILSIEAELLEPATPSQDKLRDAKDLPVLGTLLTSVADYPVTGDADLLAVADRHAILTPAQFWSRHGG